MKASMGMERRPCVTYIPRVHYLHPDCTICTKGALFALTEPNVLP